MTKPVDGAEAREPWIKLYCEWRRELGSLIDNQCSPETGYSAEYRAGAAHSAALVAEARLAGIKEGLEMAANLCETWRDQNKEAAAAERRTGGTSMADRLDGAAIEANALATAIRPIPVGDDRGRA